MYGEWRPNEALVWGAIMWAKAAGYSYFDADGIDPLGSRALVEGKAIPEPLKKSPIMFKLSFGGEIVVEAFVHFGGMCALKKCAQLICILS